MTKNMVLGEYFGECVYTEIGREKKKVLPWV